MPLVLLGLASACAPVGATQTSQVAPTPAYCPAFHASANAELVRPDWQSFLNQDGSPRLQSEPLYERFWTDVAPSLRIWAEDPRLDLNPAYIAALLTKESAFEPFATSGMPANGYPQMTHIADADMVEIAHDAEHWNWILEEVERWPRHPSIHRADALEAVTDSLVEAGAVAANNEYFFDPLTSTRGAVFWLRMLAEIWTEEEYPGRYATFARSALADGGDLSEGQLIDLVTVSYNQGYTYVHDLIEQHGQDWTEFLNEEAEDYLERIRHYTCMYQGMSTAAE